MDDEFERFRNEVKDIASDWRNATLRIKPSEVSGLKLCYELSTGLDNIIRRIYEISFNLALEVAGEHYRADETEIAIVATGSYGRRHFCPFSDVDIAFIPSEQDNPFVDALIKHAFRLLISAISDATDLRLGYAYRPLEDIPNLDSVTKTALLDARLVSGSERLYKELLNQLYETIDVVAFVCDKVAERSSARESVIYSTEPNIKLGTGMLRDALQTLWLLSVVNKLHPPVPKKLCDAGVLQRNEAKMLEEAIDFYLKVRNWLHIHCGRREEVLLREYQAQIAHDFGFEGDEKSRINAFFERLYGYAEAVNSLARGVEETALEMKVEVDEHFYAEHKQLYAKGEDALLRKPKLLLVAFQHAQRYRLKLSHELKSKIRYAVSNAGNALLKVNGCGKELMRILEQPLHQDTIKEMVELGVLQAFIPELERAMKFVPSNRAHELTVGAHCVRTLMNLIELELKSTNSETLMGEVWKEVTDKGILRLSALLHDLGKVVSEDERGHCEAGASIASEVAEAMGLDLESKNLVVSLVRNHMLLLRTARLHDIQDESVLSKLANEIRDVSVLRMLYLLSYADAQAVSKQTFTELEKELLDMLFINLHRYMVQRTEVSVPTDVSEQWSHLSWRLKKRGLTQKQLEIATSLFPPGYLLNMPLEVIAERLQMVERLFETQKPVIVLHNEKGADFSELSICTYDDPTPGLLSKICGVLYAKDVDIRMAHVLTASMSTSYGKRDIVLDTLYIRTRYGQVSDAKARQTRETLERVLSGEISVDEVLTEAGFETDFPVNVLHLSISNAISKGCTVIHIKADDRRGLLFRITKAISSLGLDILMAKINTWRDVAEDSFYVVVRGGGKIPDDALRWFETELMKRLTGR